MVVTTSTLYSTDSKHILYEYLKEEFDALTAAYPTKVSVKVTKVYPKTIEDLDKYSAVVTISRISAPQEMLFVGDTMQSGINTDDKWSKSIGVLNTDFYEICVWSLDPDYRDQMYYVVRQIMLEKRDTFLNAGFTQVIRTGGGDQEVDLIATPRIVYRGIHVYKIQSPIKKENLYDVISELDITQTVRVNIDSATNEKSETRIVP